MSTILDALRRVESARLGAGAPEGPDDILDSKTSVQETLRSPVGADLTLETVQRDLAECEKALAKCHEEIQRLRERCATLGQEVEQGRHGLGHAESLIAERDALLSQREDKLACYVEDNARLNGRVEALTLICQRRQKQIEAYREQLRLLQLPEPAMIEAAQEGVGDTRKLGSLLLQTGLLRPEHLQEALEEQTRGPRRHLGTILVGKGYLEEHAIAEAISRQLGLPLVHLVPARLDLPTARLVRRNLSERHLCIPFALRDRDVLLAMANPHDIVAIDHVEMSTGRRAVIAVATPTNILAAIAHAYTEH